MSVKWMNGSLLANYIYLQLVGKTENYFRSLYNMHVIIFYINRKALLLVVLLVWNESMNLGKEKHITD